MRSRIQALTTSIAGWGEAAEGWSSHSQPLSSLQARSVGWRGTWKAGIRNQPYPRRAKQTPSRPLLGLESKFGVIRTAAATRCPDFFRKISPDDVTTGSGSRTVVGELA